MMRFGGAATPASSVLLGLALLPRLECSTIDLEGACGPGDIAARSLSLSVILGLLGYGLWIGFVVDRVWLTPSRYIFRSVRAQDRMLLVGSLAFNAAGFLVMLFNLPG